MKYPMEKIKELRNSYKLDSYLEKILIGLLLSDGHLERISPKSTRLSVSFGSKNSQYLMFLYKFFEPFTNSEPKIIKTFNKRTNTNHDIIKFNTVSLPLFTQYHEMFYKVNDKGRNEKIIPLNIKDIMNSVVLAHLIMGDGNLKQPDKILRIYTNSFSPVEVELLASAISDKLNIKTKAVHDRNNQYIITISKTELAKVQNLVGEHMDSSMFYKIDR